MYEMDKALRGIHALMHSGEVEGVSKEGKVAIAGPHI